MSIECGISFRVRYSWTCTDKIADSMHSNSYQHTSLLITVVIMSHNCGPGSLSVLSHSRHCLTFGIISVTVSPHLRYPLISGTSSHPPLFLFLTSSLFPASVPRALNRVTIYSITNGKPPRMLATRTCHTRLLACLSWPGTLDVSFAFSKRLPHFLSQFIPLRMQHSNM